MHRHERQGAFTLLELIVVITIIGIFGTIVMVNYGGFTTKAKIAKAKEDTRAIREAARMIQIQTGNWPNTVEECVNARDPNTDSIIPGSLEKYPKDPWGNDYIYDLREEGPVVICYGKDGIEGGDGENADIVEPEQQDQY